MGIQNFIGDITSNVGQSIQGFLDSAWSAVSGIGERVGTFVANIWDGGFAGVSNYDGLKTAISNYSKDVQDIVNQYQPDADISDSFQGQSAEALHEFVTSTKSLLDAYVALVEKWNTEHPDKKIDLIYTDDANATPLHVSDGTVDFEFFDYISLEEQVEKSQAQSSFVLIMIPFQTIIQDIHILYFQKTSRSLQRNLMKSYWNL